MWKWIINAYRKYRLMKRIRDESIIVVGEGYQPLRGALDRDDPPPWRFRALPRKAPPRQSHPVVIRGTGPRQAPPKHDFGGKPPGAQCICCDPPFSGKIKA